MNEGSSTFGNYSDCFSLSQKGQGEGEEICHIPHLISFYIKPSFLQFHLFDKQLH